MVANDFDEDEDDFLTLPDLNTTKGRRNGGLFITAFASFRDKSNLHSDPLCAPVTDAVR